MGVKKGFEGVFLFFRRQYFFTHRIFVNIERRDIVFIKRSLFYLLVRHVEKSTLEQLPVHQDRQNGWGKETLLHSFLADTLTLFEEACSRGIVSTLIPMYRGTTINFSKPKPIVEVESFTSIAAKSR